MERVDLLAIVGGERQVKVRRLLLGSVQTQGSRGLRAELDTVRGLPLPGDRYAERFERFEEERLARFIVADAEFDVIEHEPAEA
jgi:hypothetical protein